ncbi:retrovirus-related pol polyprotein from transposon TNT 1-94 [Tanacetum coccineum]
MIQSYHFTMANMSEDIQCAGSDTRPPMLDKADFESWQQRIREEGALHLGPEQDRVFSDFTPEEKERYKADICATNIILQGLPKDIYTLINHYTDAKDIWDNVKMLLEGSELTKDDHESQLYDDFEHFRQNKGETIHEYYVRFTKLINDMRNIKITMPKMQLNSKFVNNVFPEWGRFVTEVKHNRGLKSSNYDQLYAYLKQHEVHANENNMILEKFSQPTSDPLALVSDASLHHYPPQSSTFPQAASQPPLADTTQLDSRFTPTDNLIEIQKGRVVVQNVQGNQNRGQGNRGQGNNARGVVAVGNGGVQNRGANANQGQANPIKCYNCNGIGHIARQSQENKVVLDEEQLLFIAGGLDNSFDDDVDEEPVQDLALNQDNIFQANECDSFDSDVDEALTAQTIFMANLSSASPIYDKAGSSYDSDIISEVVQIVLWYLDSGCSKHMTGNRSWLKNFMKKFIGTVKFGNDHFGAIMGYEDYVIGDGVISRVYYMEGLGHNLYTVGHDEVLPHLLIVQSLQKQIMVVASSIKPSELWYHQRSYTKRFGTRLATVEVQERPSLLGLSTRKEQESINGKKYILVIVDDYSRFTWVKFLRSKDETPDVGIFHQKFVPRTPQQNGVVKRRNHTLVEAARTMLLFSKALMFLWAEAVATACYTQNRSLFHTRLNKTPYELVHDKKCDLTFF